MVRRDPISFTCSVAGGPLGCFHFVTVVNNVAVSVAHKLLHHMFSVLSGVYLGVELLGHMLLYTYQWNNVSMIYSCIEKYPEASLLKRIIKA